VRKELTNIKPTQSKHEDFGKGIYSDETSRLTYEKIYQLTEQYIKQGKPVIIDASFKKRAERQRAYALAKDLGVPFYIIECTCPDKIIRKRLEKRAKESDNISDGRWEIFQEQKNDFDAIGEFPERLHFKIDTSANPEKTQQIIIRKLNFELD